MNNKGKRKDYTVYIPPGADINLENSEKDPPKTGYENRRKTVDIESVKKIVGGEYGRTSD
jgi:hypothetical protein